MKVQGSKFGLSSRIYNLPNGGTKEVPCYVLTKTECLYIATKFNDEARARLVLALGRAQASLALFHQKDGNCMGENMWAQFCADIPNHRSDCGLKLFIRCRATKGVGAKLHRAFSTTIKKGFQ